MKCRCARADITGKKEVEDASSRKTRGSHAVNRLGWLRAAVLGANDGILSTSSLIIGVASAHGTHQSVLIAGVSGLVAGAMSMASGDLENYQSLCRQVGGLGLRLFTAWYLIQPFLSNTSGTWRSACL
jgi:VIT1/CCC1 family predicted Fe2+/Mn2+ transporter